MLFNIINEQEIKQNKLMGQETKQDFFINEKTKRYVYLAEVPNKEIMYYFTSFGHEYLNMNYYVDRQDLDLFMINYVVNGSLALIVDGKHYVINKGDLCFLNLAKHSILYPLEENTEIYFFHFYGHNIKEIYNIYLNQGQYITPDFSLESIRDFYEKCVYFLENLNNPFERSTLIYGLLMKIISLRSDKKVYIQYPELVRKVIHYIWKTFPTPTPQDIAKHFDYSAIYLERQFKQYVGETLGHYLLKKKYEQACQCFMDTDMTVNEVANYIGYSTPQGLILLFKKIGNTTPLAFKKGLKK